MKQYIDNIKRVDLVFENTDYVSFEREHIENFYLRDIKKCYVCFANGIAKMWTVEEFCIEINSKANTKEIDFFNDGERYKFDRIQDFSDITSVEIWFEDDKKERYYVVFSDEKNEINMYQKDKISSSGNMCIAIGKDLDINEIFPDE